ncbi:MAG: hypothetical protein ABI273_20660 [Lacunisphaera sp.]
MAPEKQSPLSPSSDAVANALATIHRSQPEDYDGHTEFESLSPDARLSWLESAVRFIQASKEVRRAPKSQQG